MTTTFYVDANRSNSSRKENVYKNEWTYKLSNPILLPPQSEIALQDTFINRKGITGQTIEIDEDITETIRYTYFVSDNPHFVPSSQFEHGSNQNVCQYFCSSWKTFPTVD